MSNDIEGAERQKLASLPLPASREPNPEDPVNIFSSFKGDASTQRHMRRVIALIARGSMQPQDKLVPRDIFRVVRRFPTALDYEMFFPQLTQAVDAVHKPEERAKKREEYLALADRVGGIIYGDQWTYLKKLRANAPKIQDNGNHATPIKVEAKTEAVETASIPSGREVVTLGSETKGIKPEELLGQINQKLATASSSRIRLQTSPQAVLDYLQTIELPLGSRIKEGGSIQIVETSEGSMLALRGIVGTKVGNAKFDVTFQQTPERRLVAVGKPKINIDLGLKIALKGFGVKTSDIEDIIKNVDKAVTDQMGQKIDPNWEVESLHISGQKLAFDLRKKAS